MGTGDSPREKGMDGTIRDQLWARIAALDVRAPYAPVADLAHAHGLAPAVTVTHFIDRALSRSGGTATVHGWLTMLTDAVASERQDFETANHFATVCSVRLAG